LEAAKKKLLDTGFQELVFEDAMDLLQKHVSVWFLWQLRNVYCRFTVQYLPVTFSQRDG
jgi:hypothetical protein